MNTKKKVVVGMSGGVDSSVAALLLLEQGYDVIGVTMQLWQGEEQENGVCCGLSAVEDARRVAQLLAIPYYVLNFQEVFRRKVTDDFAASYLRGQTPNPCIACNRFVKWGALLRKSMEIGADYIATGHYARVEHLANGRYAIRCSVTDRKDQSYVLYNLTQEQLAHTLLPVGDYAKEKIREIADRAGLPISRKPDSQDLCFVPDGDYASFIESYTGQTSPEGNFVDVNGRVLGRHRGILHYTVGQRKRLGLSLGERVFVTGIRPETNEVVIGDRAAACSVQLRAERLNFMAAEDLMGPCRLWAKIRYNHAGAFCTVKRTGPDEVTCVFEEPQHGVTPGQAVVFYDGGYVLGGGTIR